MKPQPFPWYRQRSLFFSIGLVTSLGLVICAFEMRTAVTEPLVMVLPPLEEPIFTAPVTQLEPPKPKLPEQPRQETKKPAAEVVEVDDWFPLDSTLLVEPPIVDDPAVAIALTAAVPDETLGQEEPIIDFADEQPQSDRFYPWLQKKLRYPDRAQREQISGTVYVQFVVEKDGALTDVQVAKGIGYGCDEEALRVVRSAPAWQPGRQRGRPVRVRMVVPIRFTLRR
ncbi:protein TonB [Catalinimonas alkaloidigena]|uniref:Protein TonB n=1 Tax=Catalinimonas alkaloidigena TaxID=1075417 RepID=A0A1G9PME9_9BACT|nr:energy transducer TonB [Catalinimonas alkaloidigena]SDL99753.1 protein TonB [Catalinimonas alkaloidigena]